MITFLNLGKYGQLGNQLFQYATLRAVAESMDCEMSIPMHGDKPKGAGLVELGALSLACKPLTDTDARHIRNQYIERSHAFDPDVFNQPDWTDFLGFFQTEKYFKHLRQELLREFTFRDSIGAYASRYVAAIRAQVGKAPLVAVHVRRGDYLKKPEHARILTQAWYRNAMDMFATSRPVFLIFSDDPGWCAENLGGLADRQAIRRLPWTLQVTTPDHWHDLAVMTLCDHFIIAGSSFSWWGAWLCRSADKIVVAPKPWFGPKMGFHESDIVPEDWRRL